MGPVPPVVPDVEVTLVLDVEVLAVVDAVVWRPVVLAAEVVTPLDVPVVPVVRPVLPVEVNRVPVLPVVVPPERPVEPELLPVGWLATVSPHAQSAASTISEGRKRVELRMGRNLEPPAKVMRMMHGRPA